MNWLEEFKEVQDKRVLWDLIKYKIRQRTITYSKGKARERRAKLQKVEDKLKECTEKCDIDPNSGNLEELECLQTEYDQLYDYITQGQPFTRGQRGMKWMRKTTNIFNLNLENSNKTKSSVRKILTRDGALTSDPKKIMNELELYYSNLYDGSRHADYFPISSFINDLKKDLSPYFLLYK